MATQYSGRPSSPFTQQAKDACNQDLRQYIATYRSVIGDMCGRKRKVAGDHLFRHRTDTVSAWGVCAKY